MAAEMGRRLLAEVQEVGLDEILQTVRIQHDPEPAYFGIPALDKIVNSASAKRTTTNIPSSNPGPPILELIPQAPGSGTTHLLYLLTATAILPTSMGGRDSCVAIIDTDNTFCVSRLVQQLRVAIRLHNQNHPGSEKDQQPSKGTTSEAEADALEEKTVDSALRHVHLFRPQSHSSLLATLDSLPAYFLQNNSNPSLHRPLAFIALASLPAFHWQQRAESETKAFEEETQQQNQQPSDLSTTPPPPPKPLPQLLQLLSQTFPSTPLLITNPSHYPRLSSLSSHHVPLRIISLTLSRAQTRPFPPMISLTEALREKEQREIAVGKAGWWVGSSMPASGGGTIGFEIRSTSERGVWVVES